MRRCVSKGWRTIELNHMEYHYCTYAGKIISRMLINFYKLFILNNTLTHIIKLLSTKKSSKKKNIIKIKIMQFSFYLIKKYNLTEIMERK